MMPWKVRSGQECIKISDTENSLRAGREIFKHSKVQVIGVSADPVNKQKEFVEKQKLTVRDARILSFCKNALTFDS